MSSERFKISEDGTIEVQSFKLPISAALSPQTRAVMAMMIGRAASVDIPTPSKFAAEIDYKNAVDAFRKNLDEGTIKPWVEGLAQQFPARIEAHTLGGVRVEEVLPTEQADPERVLINLHGGAFCSGAIYVGRLESIPMAHLGKFRVISVDYRQGYEHKYPAATEDVVSVYHELLKTYAPSKIGIYGGSAGGMLTAQVTAWLIEHGLPLPGAIGIFGAGAGGEGDGDYFSAIGSGHAPTGHPLGRFTEAEIGYFSTTRPDDYVANPNLAPLAFRAKFPPTLIITATRAFDLSPALATHRALSQAGVDASLHVFDGLGHCFYYNAAAPEGADAYDVMIRFFRKHLR